MLGYNYRKIVHSNQRIKCITTEQYQSRLLINTIRLTSTNSNYPWISFPVCLLLVHNLTKNILRTLYYYSYYLRR